MSTHVKQAEIKVGAPTNFKGNMNDATRWKYTVWAYVAMNAHVYTTDDKKIILALNHMTEGSAGTWAQNFYTQAFSATPVKFGMWEDFWIQLGKAFLPVDQAIVAITKLTNLTQGKDIAKYITQFKTLYVQANIKEDISLIHFFEQGLNPGLRRQIYAKEEVPKTIDKWIAASVQLDANWQRGQVIIRSQSQKTYRGNWSIPKPQINCRHDPDAMDVDRLSEEGKNI